MGTDGNGTILNKPARKSLLGLVKWTLAAKGFAVGTIVGACTLALAIFVYFTMVTIKEAFGEYKDLSTRHETLSLIASNSLQTGQAIRNLYIDPTDDDAARNLKSAIEKASELGKKLSTASKEDYKDISFELNDYLSDVSSISALISGKSSIEKSNILMNTLKWRKLKTKLTQKIEVLKNKKESIDNSFIELLSSTNKRIFGFGIITIFITFVSIFAFYLSVHVATKRLKKGLLGFFDYL